MRSVIVAPSSVEERVADVEPVEDALGAEVADRHDRSRGRARRCSARNRVGDLVERLVPGDLLEPAAALGPGAAQRVQHAVGAVDLVLVVVDLHAQPAAGERVLGVARDLGRPAVLDGDEHGAGVGAVVRARGAHGGGGRA